jgi:hypothetical protein
MDIGARPIVMQMSVLATQPYRYHISADSYADLCMGSAGIHIGAPPTVMQMNVLESRLRIGHIRVMRPISDTAWLHISPPGIQFNHKSSLIRSLLNEERTNHWRGHVDICYLECLFGQ